MLYLRPTIGVPQAGFFRSSMASLVGGGFAGASVIATALDPAHLELRAALASFLTAAAIALTDYVTRRRKEREHSEAVVFEHEKTRTMMRAVLRELKKSRK